MEKEKTLAHFRIYLLLALAIIPVLPLSNAAPDFSNMYRFVYDEFSDSSVNWTLWKNTTTGTGSSFTENTEYIEIISSNSGSSSGTLAFNSTNFTAIDTIDGLNISVYLLASSTTGGGESAVVTLKIFGTTISSLSSAIGTETTYNANLTFSRNSANSSKFDIYVNGAFSSTITPTDNVITITESSQGSTTPTRTGTAQARIYYTYLYYQNDITLIQPINNGLYSTVPIFNSSILSIVNQNLTNATIYVWNSSGIFNSTTTTFNTNATVYPSWNITGFSLGTYTWNVLACTSLHCNYAPSNYSFGYGFDATNTTFNNNILETTSQTFSINLTMPSGFSVNSIIFHYNGTNYTSTSYSQISSTLWMLNKTIVIPAGQSGFVTANRNFYWIITIADISAGTTSTFSTASETQTVNELSLSLCGGSYNVPVVNFTLYNEKTDIQINATQNATTFQGTFYYGLSSDGQIKNYSINNQSVATSTFNFCTSNYTSPLYTDLDLVYDAVGFYDRNYYLRDAQLTNITNLINLYLIPEDVGQKFFFDVRRGGAVFPNAIVTISKYFEGLGAYKTISIKVADGDGKFTEYLELDKQYRYLVSDGSEVFGIIDRSSICSAAPCEETLQVEDPDTDIFDAYYSLFAQNISYSLNYSVDTKTVYFTYVDLTGLAAYARLEVIQTSLNSSSATICNVFSYSSFGSMSCNLSAYTGDFVANVYISRSPEVFIDYLTIFVQDIYEQVGDTGILVVIFLLFLTIGAFWADPKIGMLMIVVNLILLRFIELLPLSWGAISAIAITCLAIIGLMGREQ